jgi:hypothetical protein
MGSVPQAMAKFFSIFSIIFTLFGILWALWDSFHALFLTDSILKYGITAPLPYSLVFNPISSDAFKVTTPLNPASPATGGAFNVANLVPEVPVPVLSYKKDVMPLVAPAIGLVQQGLGAVDALKQSAQDTLNSVQQQVQQQVQQTVAPAYVQTGGGQHFSESEGPGPVIAGVLTAVVIAGGLKGAYDYLRSR